MLNRPDVIEGVHNSMLEAGAEVLETDTFQASRLKLAEWGLDEHTHEINLKAAQIARKAAGERRFVAGSIGPTGFLPASDDPTLGQIAFTELVDVFTEQAHGLVQGGVDLIIIETAQDILEVKAAVFGAREAFKQNSTNLPIQCSVSLLPQGGKMLLGTDISAVLATLEALDIDIIGLNCSTGPEDMRDAIRFLGEHSRVGPSTASPTPGSRCRDRTARRSSQRSPSRSRTCLGNLSSATACRSSAAAAGRRRRTSRRSPSGSGTEPARARPQRRDAAPEQHDRRHPARPGPAPDARRRARQLAGLAQGQGAAAGRRLRRPGDRRRGPGHTAARTCSTSASR